MASSSRLTLNALVRPKSQVVCSLPPTSLNASARLLHWSARALAKPAAAGKGAKGKAAATVSAGDAAAAIKKPAADSSIKYDSSNDTSSAPAGTVLSGLSIYKDRADPIARPDSHYPPWLWTILSSGSGAPASTEAGMMASIAAETAGMSKGEARVAQKRLMKERRAAMRTKQAAEERAQAQVTAKATQSTPGAHASAPGEVAPGGSVDAAAAKAAGGQEADESTIDEEGMSAEEKAERERKRELRKASRKAIKTKNFVSSS